MFSSPSKKRSTKDAHTKTSQATSENMKDSSSNADGNVEAVYKGLGKSQNSALIRSHPANYFTTHASPLIRLLIPHDSLSQATNSRSAAIADLECERMEEQEYNAARLRRSRNMAVSVDSFVAFDDEEQSSAREEEHSSRSLSPALHISSLADSLTHSTKDSERSKTDNTVLPYAPTLAQPLRRSTDPYRMMSVLTHPPQRSSKNAPPLFDSQDSSSHPPREFPFLRFSVPNVSSLSGNTLTLQTLRRKSPAQRASPPTILPRLSAPRSSSSLAKNQSRSSSPFLLQAPKIRSATSLDNRTKARSHAHSDDAYSSKPQSQPTQRPPTQHHRIPAIDEYERVKADVRKSIISSRQTLGRLKANDNAKLHEMLTVCI